MEAVRRAHQVLKRRTAVERGTDSTSGLGNCQSVGLDMFLQPFLENTIYNSGALIEHTWDDF